MALFHLNSAANVALCPVMPVVPPGTAEKNTAMYASFPSVVYAGISVTFSVISKESASLLYNLIGLFPKIIALGTGEFSFPDTDSDSFSCNDLIRSAVLFDRLLPAISRNTDFRISD